MLVVYYFTINIKLNKVKQEKSKVNSHRNWYFSKLVINLVCFYKLFIFIKLFYIIHEKLGNIKR